MSHHNSNYPNERTTRHNQLFCFGHATRNSFIRPDCGGEANMTSSTMSEQTWSQSLRFILFMPISSTCTGAAVGASSLASIVILRCIDYDSTEGSAEAELPGQGRGSPATLAKMCFGVLLECEKTFRNRASCLFRVGCTLADSALHIHALAQARHTRVAWTRGIMTRGIMQQGWHASALRIRGHARRYKNPILHSIRIEACRTMMIPR